MAATIKDIAQKLNISMSTVSYALNGGPRRVPDTVRDRVLAAAFEMDYRPNALARSMVTGRTETIAVVFPNGTHPLLCSPYVLTVLNGIVEAAEELEQDVLLRTQTEKTDPQELARILLSGKADGVLLVAPELDSTIATEIARRRFPCVVLSADGPESTVTITTDNAAATDQAMRYLVSMGHRHIGHVAGRIQQRDGKERLEAYRSFLCENGLPLQDKWIVEGDFSYDITRRVGRDLCSCSERPTAVLAGNDESGLGLIDAARELGIRVPEELSVVAYDLLPQLFLQMRQISATRQPLREMTALAVRVLVNWVHEGKPPDQMRYVLPTEMVEMGTATSPSSVA